MLHTYCLRRSYYLSFFSWASIRCKFGVWCSQQGGISSPEPLRKLFFYHTSVSLISMLNRWCYSSSSSIWYLLNSAKVKVITPLGSVLALVNTRLESSQGLHSKMMMSPPREVTQTQKPKGVVSTLHIITEFRPSTFYFQPFVTLGDL